MKTLRNIGNLILTVLIICSATACSDENENEVVNPNIGNQSEKLIKSIIEEAGGKYQMSYKGKKLSNFKYYDYEGDLDTNISFSYSENKATMYDQDNKLYYEFNEKGYVTSIYDKNRYFEGTCSYDSDGYITQLISEENEDDYSYSSTIDFSYDNGNLIKSIEKNIEDGEEDITLHTYFYSEHENKSMLNFIGYDEFDYFLYSTSGFLGKASKNLVSEIWVSEGGVLYEDKILFYTWHTIYEYTYEFDSKGYVTKIHVKRSANSSDEYTETYTLNY
ncbi:DUF4595 domain-containing protein [Bacteroidales bacterium OttesenSCG-928-M11]|nr:DUF4595 domain-containing protein [Bacteroidales bacterium OttesenSCG-928-M11]